MLTFRIDDMTCGHCARTITQAVHGGDAQARVEVDMAQHLVRITTAAASDGEIREAITGAGYTPVPVQMTEATPARARSGGCCCGSGRSACAA